MAIAQVLLRFQFDIDKFLAALDGQPHRINVVDERQFFSQFLAGRDHAIVDEQDQVVRPQARLLGR